MSMRFSYSRRAPFGEAARQAAPAQGEPQKSQRLELGGQSIFTWESSSLSSGGHIAASTRPRGPAQPRSMPLPREHTGQQPERGGARRRRHVRRRWHVRRRHCLRRRPTRAGGSQDSSGAGVSRARRQGTPWSVACPKEQGIATWRWSAATRPMLALNPPPLPHPESSTHHTQGHRHTFLPEVKQDSWFWSLRHTTTSKEGKNKKIKQEKNPTQTTTNPSRNNTPQTREAPKQLK